jgi:hypothetical protein
MLSYTPMKKHAGIRLEGDYTTLRALHETIHRMASEEGDRQEYKDGENLIALAYDVRKAYERSRDVIEPPTHSPEIGVRYGVKVIWPMLLLQTRQLRDALTWGPTTSMDQAMTYALEALVEAAVTQEFGVHAPAILSAYQRITPRSPGVVARHKPLCAMFCSWSEADRQKRMATLMQAFDPMHDVLHDMFERGGRDSIPPADLIKWKNAEWVDPEATPGRRRA